MELIIINVICITLCVIVPTTAQSIRINQENVKPNKPNIILIVADDLGFNDVPWHNKEVVAPNLKSLANEGIILEQSYVLPICSPTRSALLTGIYPFAIGRQSDVIWPLMPTGLTLNSYIIPQLLKPLGYSTHAVGKWHLGFCNWKYTPTERGFDSFRGYYTGSEHYFSHIRDYYSSCGKKFDKPKSHPIETHSEIYTGIPGEISDSNSKADVYRTTGYDFRNNREPYKNASGIYSTYEFASHLEEVFRSSKPETPKFVYMAFQSVHSPLEVPENYTKPYLHIKDHNRRTYLGMVTAMDEAVGRIVKSLKETGNYNNSVIIFTTDNGGPTVSGGNNWPLRGNKSTLWEGGTRGPAFVHSSFLPNPGTVSKNLIHVTDWMATLVNLAGGLPPTHTDSIDQWEALVGRAEPPRNEMVYNIEKRPHGFRAGIRVGNYKLLVGDPGPGDWTPPPEFKKKLDNSMAHFPKSERLIRLMDFEDHQKLIKEMKNKCQSLTCFQRLKNVYINELKEAKVNNELWLKLSKVLQRYLQSLRSQQRNKRNTAMNRQMIPRLIHNHNIIRLLKHSLSLKKTYNDLLDFEEEYRYNKSSIVIRLYNVQDDPKEKNDLAAQKTQIVKSLLKRLFSYKGRYVQPDLPADDPKGNPIYYNGNWSPGWC